MRGHQSLVQLIGKRRRDITLDNVADPSSQIVLTKEEASDAGPSSSNQDLVECPICSRKMLNSSINNHLDSCLRNGRNKKTKQVQLTLFQTSVTKSVSTRRCSQADGSDCHNQASNTTKQELKLETDNVDNVRVPPVKEEPVEHILEEPAEHILEEPVEHILEEPVQHILKEHIEKHMAANQQNKIDDKLSTSFDTHIVGRQFYKEAQCTLGMDICFEREPENPVDPHAVKVLSTGPEGQPIGYIPKSVAVHLSSFLCDNTKQIKGRILSVPEHLYKPVDINIQLEGEVDENWTQAISASKNVVVSFKGREENFLHLLNTVLQRDSHLFTADEKMHLGLFYLLSHEAQRLFLRLSQRKGPWFRVESISYEDVADVNSAVQDLLDTGIFISSHTNWLEADPEALGDYLEVSSVHELRQLVDMTKIMRKSDAAASKKSDLKTLIMANRSNAVFDCFMKMVGLCIRISDTTMFLLWRLQRLFFLNGEQELQVFLLVDLGKAKYPSYKCSRTVPVFSNRETLVAYEQALHLAQVVDMSLEANEDEKLHSSLEAACSELEASGSNSSAEQHPFLSRFSSAWVYATICTVAVSVYERERRYTDAIRLLKRLLETKLCPGRRGYWTLRLSVDLEHVGRPEESLEVAENGLMDPCIRGGDLIALQRRIIRLGKPPRRWKVPPFATTLKRKHKVIEIIGRPLNNVVGVKSRFYGYDGEQCSVEELALGYYAREEGGSWTGVHSESGIWLTLFGLLMWDIIFSEVPDVFQTPFQTAPLDLDSDVFYPARSLLIDSRLESIRCGHGAEIISQVWQQHHGTYCRGVDWERYSLEELQTIAGCVGGTGLSAVCKLLSEDRARWASGMPDLLLWKTHAGRSYAKLSEVKGPGDRLSEQQTAWLFTLSDAGVDVEVCKVVKSA